MLCDLIDYLWPSVSHVYLVTERKESKGSITNSDEIVIADTAHINGTTAGGTAVATATVATKVTTVYEENEKTGKTDVSDKSK